MIELLAAFLGGVAANQLDDPISKFNSSGWELIARYIVGVLTAEFFFVMMLRRLNPSVLRDGVLAFNGAFAGMGIGVIMARIGKDLTEAHK